MVYLSGGCKSAAGSREDRLQPLCHGAGESGHRIRAALHSELVLWHKVQLPQDLDDAPMVAPAPAVLLCSANHARTRTTDSTRP
jgi:hypothetical protein